MGKLYIIGTPIGNLKDISIRAIQTLKKLDILYCEDTRITKKLLNRYKIKMLTKSYNEHNELKRIPEIINLLKQGKVVGLVSDAGMPVISDPGYKLIREVLINKLELDIIPGPTAFVSALILSGFPPNSFYFGGFLPDKRGKRQKKLLQIKDLNCTLIFYLSPYKVYKTIEDIYTVLGDRKLCLIREITKLYQERLVFSAKEFLEKYKDKKWKGELVLLIKNE